jgi:pilus assembly protein CpaC
MLRSLKRLRPALIFALALGVTAAHAQTPVEIDPLGSELIHAGEFVVPINKSQVLKVDQPFTELLIGNPEIADVVALTNQ